MESASQSLGASEVMEEKPELRSIKNPDTASSATSRSFQSFQPILVVNDSYYKNLHFVYHIHIAIFYFTVPLPLKTRTLIHYFLSFPCRKPN